LDARVALAANNNARWCLAVCQAHGCRTSLEDGYWACADPPRYYSNLVTLRPGLGPLVGVVKPGGFKDSFSDIDGQALGYRELFRASWLWRDPTPLEPTSLEWHRAATDAELLAWEAGWAAGDDGAQAAPRQFPVSLLDDPDLAFMAGFADGVLAAGFALNRTAPVVGVSNTFVLTVGYDVLWHEIQTVAASMFGDMPLVGYERGAELAHAQSAGFERTNELRVWIR
jgi:hypothetical protein